MLQHLVLREAQRRAATCVENDPQAAACKRQLTFNGD
jgi:hypothetical protein